MLDSTLALRLAGRLTVVKEFPRNPEAIEAVAEDFIDLTRDCDDEEAEKRVRWITEHIRRNWTQWSTQSELLGLYRSKFDKPREIKSEDNEAKNYGPRPKIQCKTCRDTGVFRPGENQPYQWCECEAGIHLHFDLPDWLDILNRPARRASQRSQSPEPTNRNFQPVTQADIDRAVEENRNRKAQTELGDNAA